MAPFYKNEYCEEEFKKPKYGKRVKELDVKRRELLATVSKSDLVWTKFPLRNDPKQDIKDAPYTIEVSRVVSKSGIFIPVTTDEAFAMASAWKVFPLTSAVMDQTAFGSNYVPRKFMSNLSPDIFDFETYSEYLKGTLYKGAVCVGAHKVWLISGRARQVNYGFHFRESGRMNALRYFGNGWRLLQSEGKGHEGDTCFWDYSQLIQFMRNLQTKDGQSLDLKDEIKNKNPALWYSFEPNAPGNAEAKRFP